jgi:hypothetical protein
LFPGLVVLVVRVVVVGIANPVKDERLLVLLTSKQFILGQGD